MSAYLPPRLTSSHPQVSELLAAIQGEMGREALQSAWRIIACRASKFSTEKRASPR